MRSLAPGTDLKPYSKFEVVKSIKVQSGEIAPWFDQPGKGVQYKFDKSIKTLIEEGYIKRVEK